MNNKITVVSTINHNGLKYIVKPAKEAKSFSNVCYCDKCDIVCRRVNG